MATTIQSFGFVNSPLNVRESAIGATGVMDIKAGVAGYVLALDIDNTANGAASYFKGYDAGIAVVGTTVPDLVIMIPASVRRTILFVDGFDFANFSFACVTVGGTTGVTPPTSSVVVDVMAT